MRDREDTSTCRPEATGQPASQAEHLAALAKEARLLEFALEGDGDDARRIANDLEAALERVMDAESADDLTNACTDIRAALGEVVERGMRLSAELTDMEVEGVLGATRMPVLTAVLSASRPA